MQSSAESPRTLRVLFLCTHNANRSQMAEAILAHKARTLPSGRFVVSSAGSHPGDQVNPWAVRTLAEHGIAWNGRRPKSIDDVKGQPWDLIITVCDAAKESCPILPGKPAFAHWSIDDPSEADASSKKRAYDETFSILSERIDHLLADLP